MEIHVLHHQGKSIRAISGELDVSVNTVRRYLQLVQVPAAQQRARKPTKLDAYKDYLDQHVAAARPYWIPATVLFDEIAAMGYSGCVTMYVHMFAP